MNQGELERETRRRGRDVGKMRGRLVTSAGGREKGFRKGRLRGRAFRDKWGIASSGLYCL